MENKVCILSIDGGGIRGILPGVIIEYIESRLQERTNNPEARISDFFDLIAGTSTGGILSCLYLTPNENGRPKYSAAEAVDLYLKNGGQIFSESFWQKITNPFAARKAKYSPSNLEKILKKYLGDVMLSEALKPCLITSYEIFQRKSVFFNATDTRLSFNNATPKEKQNELRNFKLRDIARSTSAAPTYFPPASIESKSGAPYYLVDGGTFANNPAMCAYTEARTIDFGNILNKPGKPNKPDINNIVLISIGTGSENKPYKYEDAKDWGAINWLFPTLDILMSGNSETVHYELDQLFKSQNCSDCYHRLSPSIGTAENEMDNASQKNMIALQGAGKTFVSSHQKELEDIIDLLLKNNKL